MQLSSRPKMVHISAMELPDEAHITSEATLASLGFSAKDEMSLAEFPIALVTDRVPEGEKTIRFQDRIYDERKGQTVTRKLVITAVAYHRKWHNSGRREGTTAPPSSGKARWRNSRFSSRRRCRAWYSWTRRSSYRVAGSPR